MTPFFTRLKFAFRTFFAILFRDLVPHDVAAALVLERETTSVPGAAPSPRQPVAAAASVVPAAPVTPAPQPSPEPTATQMLALLQRDGRLIDFLMEDITPYADAQVGAAVRSVHAACRQALQQYVTLTPALEGTEGARVTVDAGADAARVKVIGNVAGQPPFTGVLNHRGWVVTRIELPPLSATGRQVVAPAEVEVA
jgi:hypothetical protein